MKPFLLSADIPNVPENFSGRKPEKKRRTLSPNRTGKPLRSKEEFIK